MMTKFMNKQRGLLAAIMALVMVFAGAAFVAAEVDASGSDSASTQPKVEVILPEGGFVAGVPAEWTVKTTGQHTGKVYGTGTFDGEATVQIKVGETYVDWTSGNFGGDDGFDYSSTGSTTFTAKIDTPGTYSLTIQIKAVDNDSIICQTNEIEFIVWDPVTKENIVSKIVNPGNYILIEDVSGEKKITESFTVGTGVTIDLNNHILEVDCDSTTDIQSGVIFSGDATLKNGTFNVTFSGSTYADREYDETGKADWELANAYISHAVCSNGKLTLDGVSATIYNNSTTESITDDISIKAMGNSFGLQAKTLDIINGSNVTVSGANRGIYAGDITIEDESIVNAYGFERGIVRMDSTGVQKIIIDNSTVNAYLLEGGKTNGFTADDRCGIKAEALEVKVGSTVNTYGLHIEEADSSVAGILNVYNYVPTNKDDKFSGFVIDDENSIGVSGAGKIVLGTGVIIDAKFTNDDNVAILNGIKTGSDAVIKAGSVYINGVFTEATNGTISITEDAVISGEIGAGIEVTVSAGSTLTVPAGETLVNNGTIALEAGTDDQNKTEFNVVGDMSGDGTVNASENYVSVTATNPSSIKDKVTGATVSAAEIIRPIVSTTIDSTNAATLEADASKYTAYILSGNTTISAGVVLTLPENITLYLNGYTLTIDYNKADKKAGELILDGAKVRMGVPAGYAGANTAGFDGAIINVEGNLTLDGADVRAPVVEVESIDGITDPYITILNAKTMKVSGSATAELEVGYGNTLVLADLTVPAGKAIKAFGLVQIDGTVTIQKGAQFNVYLGGSADITGELVIEGTANVNGAADITGTVKVYTKDGGASFNVGTTGVVDVTGTMDVLKGTNDKQNTLDVDSQKFNVVGTLTITGTLAGNVNDMGTVSFNGTAAGTDAKITIFDGMTITIASVNGQLTVEDDIDTTDFIVGKEISSASNKVTLNNVKNVTVSTEVTETVEENASKQKIRYYTLNMTVSGAVVAVNDTVDDAKVTVENSATGWAAEKADDCNVTIGDITLGKAVDLEVKTINAEIAGTITVSAEGAGMTITGAVVDVTGTVVNVSGGQKSADTINLDAKVNAAKYTTEDIVNAISTIYYTTLENALAASASDADETIELLGTMKIESELEIPAGITLDTSDANVTIDVDGKITVAATAVLEGENGTIDVDGMLVIMDKETGLNEPKVFTYQVLNETETTATYSGLVLALQNAVAGDVITLKQDAEITKSVTIPEGVTLVVPKNVTLSIGDDKDDVTLTVAGTLKVEETIEAADDAQEVEIVITGVIIGADNIDETDLTMDNYVSFDMKIDGRLTHIHSNLAYAATNAVDGDVDIVGDVSGGDVTFTVADKKELKITVTNDSTLTVGTLTLVGAGASITTAPAVGASGSTPAKEAGVITGTIAAAAGSVDLNKVSGITFTVGVETTVDASTDVVIIAGTPVGSFEVATGVITAADDFAMNASKDNKMSVATGATLIVDNDFTASGNKVNDDVYDVIIDGTISVIKNGKATIEYTTVNGTIDVASEGTLIITSATVNGTISVAEKTDDAVAGVANVNGALVLGAAPALGANGAFVGPVDIIGNAYVIAYAGADVSAALIDVENGESTAKSTEIVLNGVPYMTVYVDKGNTTTDLEALQDYLEVEGYETEIEWADPASNDTVIGSIEKVEGTLTAAKTKLTVSAGVGLKVYIDGLAIENFKGLYDVVKSDTSEPVDGYWIQFGTHTVSFAVESGYDGSAATITVNGVAVSNNGTFTVDVDDKEVVIIASGAVPAQSGSTVVVDEDDGMALTDILLIVLVVLIVIMAIIVALRMMRS